MANYIYAQLIVSRKKMCVFDIKYHLLRKEIIFKFESDRQNFEFEVH